MKKIKLQRDLFWSFNGISEPNFWNFMTIFLYFLSHRHSCEAWGQLKLLMNPKNVIRVRRVKNMMKIVKINGKIMNFLTIFKRPYLWTGMSFFQSVKT